MLETGANIATVFLIAQVMILLILALALTVLTARMTILLRRKVKKVMPSVHSQRRGEPEGGRAFHSPGRGPDSGARHVAACVCRLQR